MPISNIAIKGDGSEIVVGDAGRAEVRLARFRSCLHPPLPRLGQQGHPGPGMARHRAQQPVRLADRLRPVQRRHLRLRLHAHLRDHNCGRPGHRRRERGRAGYHRDGVHHLPHRPQQLIPAIRTNQERAPHGALSLYPFHSTPSPGHKPTFSSCLESKVFHLQEPRCHRGPGLLRALPLGGGQHGGCQSLWPDTL